MKRRIVYSFGFFLGVLFLITALSCFDGSHKGSNDGNYQLSAKNILGRDNFKFTSVEDLQDFLTYEDGSYPLISAHRGGPSSGYPENAIETFANTASTKPVMIECDVRLTKDSVLVLMHDESLSRTTNGKGEVHNYTLNELKSLRLKDNDGEVTKYKIPTLEEALLWGRGKVIFCLDIKKGVPYNLLSEVLNKLDAKSYAIVVTYNASQAREMHNINPDVILSVSVGNEDDLSRLLDENIPDNKLVAFVGTKLPNKSLADFLHQHEIKTILGTFGNLDKQASQKGYQMYAEYVDSGADIISTDYPLEAQKALDFYIKKRNLSSPYINK